MTVEDDSLPSQIFVCNRSTGSLLTEVALYIQPTFVLNYWLTVSGSHQPMVRVSKRSED